MKHIPIFLFFLFFRSDGVDNDKKYTRGKARNLSVCVLSCHFSCKVARTACKRSLLASLSAQNIMSNGKWAVPWMHWNMIPHNSSMVKCCHYVIYHLSSRARPGVVWWWETRAMHWKWWSARRSWMSESKHLGFCETST